jgi:hypothetical protein
MTEPQKEATPSETSEINRIKAQLFDLMNDFFNVCKNMGYETETDHEYFKGGGADSLNFIRVAFEIGRDNPSLMPRQLDVSLFNGKMREMKDLQDLNLAMKAFAKTVDTASRYKTDACYRDALAVYGYLELLERENDTEAKSFLSRLRTFLHHEKSKPSE